MSQHEVLALNTHFDNWKAERANDLRSIEPFLYYSVENITKAYNLTDEQVTFGITDHPNDAGIDALYFLAGNASIQIRDDVQLPLGGLDRIRIMIFQVKSSLSDTGFKPDDIDKFGHFVDDLLNMTSLDREMAGRYTPQILSLVTAFKNVYRSVVQSLPTLHFEFYYVTRGDGVTLNAAGRASRGRVIAAIEKHRGRKNKDTIAFNPISTVELLTYARSRRKKSRTLKWAANTIPIEDGYVGMVKIGDYFNFLKDDAGNLDELIFESNVRGNQGKTSVNRQMRNALDDGPPPDFWQLNNGVTITCANISPIDAYSLSIDDAQVVNGLQTSRQIFGHFVETKADPSKDGRVIILKLIPVTDDTIRDKIIRATNNQNPIKSSALLMTSEVHRDIEDLFKKHGLFYDRRPGFYKDQGKPITRIVSFNEVTQAAVAILLHRPDDSRARPGDYVGGAEKKADDKHKLLFKPRTSRQELAVYLKCVLILREVESFMKSISGLDYGDRRNLMFYVAYYLACKIADTHSPGVEDVLKVTSSELTQQRLTNAYETVNRVYLRLSGTEENRDSVAKGTRLLSEVKRKLPNSSRTPVSGKPVNNGNAHRKIKDVIADAEFRW
jgi:AIPR protein